MLRRELLLILPLVVTVTVGQANSGYSYYGTSNVRYQRPQPIYGRPLVLPGRPMPAPGPITAAPVVPAVTAAPAVPAVTAAPAAPAVTATPETPAAPVPVPAVTAAPAAPAVIATPETPAAPVPVLDWLGSPAPSAPAAPAYALPMRPVYSPVPRPLLPPRLIRPAPILVAPPLPPATAAPQLPATEAAPPVPPVEVIQPQPAVEQPEPIVIEPLPELVSTGELAPVPEQPLAPEPIQPSVEPEPILQPTLQPKPIREPIREPAPVLLPMPISSLEPIRKPEPIWEPAPVPQPEPIRQPEPIIQPEPIAQPGPIMQPRDISQPELAQQPELVRKSEPVQQAQPALQPEPIQDLPKPKLEPVNTLRVIPPHFDKPVALPPLLPKPQSVREPGFGRHPQPVAIYTPVTHPTQSPSLSYPTPRTVPTQAPPVYTERTPPVVVVTTQPRPPVTQAPGQLKLDFQCKEGNGHYSVEHECDTYIECKQDRAMKYACPDGLHFNPAAKSYEYPCAYPSEVKCVAGDQEQIPKPTDKCPNQYGFYSMNDGDCSRFIMCQEGLATIMNCPMGLAFNPQTSSCDWPANVPQCNPNVFKDFTCPAPPEDEDGKISDIIYKYRYGVQCKLYVACQLGHPRLLSCERGLSFDEASQSCIDEDYVTDCAVPYNEHLQ